MSVGRLALIATSAIAVGLLGYLIKNHGATRLIAGYDPEQVRDEEGFSNFVGRNLYYVAALTVLMGVVDYLGVRALWVAYVLALAGLVVRMSRGSRRFE